VVLSGNPKAVYFLVKPFDVLDANQSFRYKFEYSEYDQNQRDHIEQDAQAPLSAKLVRYDTISALSLGNVAAILLLAFVLGLLLERRFYR
jgi:thiol:disulfide interchange protein